jgi:hypothetical protein
MVNPLRPYLLNRQIEIEARKIAHAATKTCKPRPTDDEPEPVISADDDEHTKNCNSLTRAIVELAKNVKLASLQPSLPRPKGEHDEHTEERTETAADAE